MFQIVQSSIRYRDPLRPVNNNEIHMPSSSPIRTLTLLNQNVGKQKNTEK